MKLKYIILSLGILAAAGCTGELGGRIDQYADVPVPQPVTIKSSYSIRGGAVVKVNIPDDRKQCLSAYMDELLHRNK